MDVDSTSSSSGGDDSSSSSDETSSEYTTESSEDDGMETAEIEGTRLQLPQGMCERKEIFTSVLSTETWLSLSEDNKQYLQTFLPNFPGNDEEEKNKTLQMLFDCATFRFNSPLEKFHEDLKAGYFRPDIANMRKIIRKAERQEAVHRYKKHRQKLKQDVIESQRKLLSQVYNLPPGVEPKLQRPPVDPSLDIVVHRAKRRYFQVLSNIHSKVDDEGGGGGANNSGGGYCSPHDENYPEGPPLPLSRKQRRHLNGIKNSFAGSTTSNSNGIISNNNNNNNGSSNNNNNSNNNKNAAAGFTIEANFCSTMSSKMSGIDLEKYITPTRNPFYVTDETYRNMMSEHKRQRQNQRRHLSPENGGITVSGVEDCPPELNTRGITMTDVVQRTRLPFIKNLQQQSGSALGNHNNNNNNNKTHSSSHHHHRHHHHHHRHHSSSNSNNNNGQDYQHSNHNVNTKSSSLATTTTTTKKNGRSVKRPRLAVTPPPLQILPPQDHQSQSYQLAHQKNPRNEQQNHYFRQFTTSNSNSNNSKHNLRSSSDSDSDVDAVTINNHQSITGGSSTTNLNSTTNNRIGGGGGSSSNSNNKRARKPPGNASSSRTGHPNKKSTNSRCTTPVTSGSVNSEINKSSLDVMSVVKKEVVVAATTNTNSAAVVSTSSSGISSSASANNNINSKMFTPATLHFAQPKLEPPLLRQVEAMATTPGGGGSSVVSTIATAAAPSTSGSNVFKQATAASNQASTCLNQYGAPVTISDLDGIDMMNIPIDLENSDIDILDLNHVTNVNSATSASAIIKHEEIISSYVHQHQHRHHHRETHSNFLSLIRDVICSTTEQHRIGLATLEERVRVWQQSPGSSLNDWFHSWTDWAELLKSAVNFLCGNTAEQLPDDFVPYMEYKPQTDMYQWIGAGRDSDALLAPLCHYWLEHGRIELQQQQQQRHPQKQPATISTSNASVKNANVNNKRTTGAVHNSIMATVATGSVLPGATVATHHGQHQQQQQHQQPVATMMVPASASSGSAQQQMFVKDELVDIEVTDRSSQTTPPPPRHPTTWCVRKATPDEVRAFREQERRRYDAPHRAFTYRCHGYESVVGPLKGIYNAVGAGAAVGGASGGGNSTAKARGHTMLCADRPNFVTILSLVRDATARLPNGEGTRAEICELLKSSQYISSTAPDNVLQSVVSGALDRMHTQFDPCVKYDSKRKIWIYLHRNRTEEDFERLHQQFQGVSSKSKKSTAGGSSAGGAAGATKKTPTKPKTPKSEKNHGNNKTSNSGNVATGAAALATVKNTEVTAATMASGGGGGGGSMGINGGGTGSGSGSGKVIKTMGGGLNNKASTAGASTNVTVAGNSAAASAGNKNVTFATATSKANSSLLLSNQLEDDKMQMHLTPSKSSADLQHQQQTSSINNTASTTTTTTSAEEREINEAIQALVQNRSAGGGVAPNPNNGPSNTTTTVLASVRISTPPASSSSSSSSYSGVTTPKGAKGLVKIISSGTSGGGVVGGGQGGGKSLIIPSNRIQDDKGQTKHLSQQQMVAQQLLQTITAKQKQQQQTIQIIQQQQQQQQKTSDVSEISKQHLQDMQQQKIVTSSVQQQQPQFIQNLTAHQLQNIKNVTLVRSLGTSNSGSGSTPPPGGITTLSGGTSEHGHLQPQQIQIKTQGTLTPAQQQQIIQTIKQRILPQAGVLTAQQQQQLLLKQKAAMAGKQQLQQQQVMGQGATSLLNQHQQQQQTTKIFGSASELASKGVLTTNHQNSPVVAKVLTNAAGQVISVESLLAHQKQHGSLPQGTTLRVSSSGTKGAHQTANIIQLATAAGGGGNMIAIAGGGGSSQPKLVMATSSSSSSASSQQNVITMTSSLSTLTANAITATAMTPTLTAVTMATSRSGGGGAGGNAVRQQAAMGGNGGNNVTTTSAGINKTGVATTGRYPSQSTTVSSALASTTSTNSKMAAAASTLQQQQQQHQNLINARLVAAAQQQNMSVVQDQQKLMIHHHQHQQPTKIYMAANHQQQLKLAAAAASAKNSNGTKSGGSGGGGAAVVTLSMTANAANTIRMVNAANLNLTHIAGKPVLLASKSGAIQHLQGQNVILQTQPNSGGHGTSQGSSLILQNATSAGIKNLVTSSSSSSSTANTPADNLISSQDLQNIPSSSAAGSGNKINFISQQNVVLAPAQHLNKHQHHQQQILFGSGNKGSAMTSSASGGGGGGGATTTGLIQGQHQGRQQQQQGHHSIVLEGHPIRLQTSSSSTGGAIIGTSSSSSQSGSGGSGSTSQQPQRVVLATSQGQGGQIVAQQILLPAGFQGHAINIKALQGVKVIPIAHHHGGGRGVQGRQVFARVMNPAAIMKAATAVPMATIPQAAPQQQQQQQQERPTPILAPAQSDPNNMQSASGSTTTTPGGNSNSGGSNSKSSE